MVESTGAPDPNAAGDRPAASAGDYEAGVAALREVAAALPAEPVVTLGRMFNGDGVQMHNRIFAFIGRNGDLVVKLPEVRVRELTAGRLAEPVVMGTRTMREWARLPAAAGAPAWAELFAEAYEFGLTLPHRPPK